MIQFLKRSGIRMSTDLAHPHTYRANGIKQKTNFSISCRVIDHKYFDLLLGLDP